MKKGEKMWHKLRVIGTFIFIAILLEICLINTLLDQDE